MTYEKIKSKIISFFADIRIYPGGFILFGNSSYKIKGPQTREILNVLKEGDILLRRYSHYLGSLIIPGYFSHAAIYVGDNEIIHMLGAGITKEDILTFLRCDDIVVLRASEGLAKEAFYQAKAYYIAGIEYDFNFNDKPDRFYCTEFIDNLFGYPIKTQIGNRIVMPDNFLNSNFFEVVWRNK